MVKQPILGVIVNAPAQFNPHSMLAEDSFGNTDAAEELLRRALLDDSASVAVSLRVGGLPVSDALTVIFHGRRDLGTVFFSPLAA